MIEAVVLRLTSPHAHANSSKAYCESWLTRLSVDPDMDEFFYDLAAVYRAEIAALADAGVSTSLRCLSCICVYTYHLIQCIYLQLDDTNLAYLCSEEVSAGDCVSVVSFWNVVINHVTQIILESDAQRRPGTRRGRSETSPSIC